MDGMQGTVNLLTNNCVNVIDQRDILGYYSPAYTAPHVGYLLYSIMFHLRVGLGLYRYATMYYVQGGSKK